MRDSGLDFSSCNVTGISTAAQIQSDAIVVTLNLVASRLHEILR